METYGDTYIACFLPCLLVCCPLVLHSHSSSSRGASNTSVVIDIDTPGTLYPSVGVDGNGCRSGPSINPHDV